MSEIFDNALLASVCVMVVSAAMGLVAKARGRDRCLTDFEGFHVTVVRADAKRIWGRLRVYSTGIELLYSEAHQDQQGHLETSYILYGSELAKADSIRRYHHDLTPENQQRREKEIQRFRHPSWSRTLRRKLRILGMTFRDALVQLVSGVVGAATRVHAASPTLATREKDIARMSGDLVKSEATRAFDPILERYVGRRVVVEMASDRREYAGILKEYTTGFIQLLDSADEHPPAGEGDAPKPAASAPRICDLLLPRPGAHVRHGSLATTMEHDPPSESG